MPAYPAPAPFAVDVNSIVRCKKCHQMILWQTSYRTGGQYPVEVKQQNGRLESCRNWFHKCIAPPQQLSLLSQDPIPAPTPAEYKPLGSSKAAKKLAMVLFIDKASEPQLRQALTVIFTRQTASEQNCDSTIERNNEGFGGSDAYILSDICKKSAKWNGLRGKQVDLVRRKMKKYARQLVEAFENGEWRI